MSGVITTGGQARFDPLGKRHIGMHEKVRRAEIDSLREQDLQRMESQTGRPIVVRVRMVDAMDAPQHGYGVVQIVLAVCRRSSSRMPIAQRIPKGNAALVSNP